jgi:hypothetical protein
LPRAEDAKIREQACADFFPFFNHGLYLTT